MNCYHCNLPISGKASYFSEIDNRQQPMCCPGCKAVAETILSGGMGDYYHYRTEPAARIDEINERLKAEYRLYDQERLQQDFVRGISDSECEAQLILEGITCAACVWLIESHLLHMEGVTGVNVNLAEHTVRIRWQKNTIKLSRLFIYLYDIGYKPHPWHVDKLNSLMKKEHRNFLFRLAVAGVGAMQVMMYAVAMYAGAMQDMEPQHQNFLRWVSAIVATPVVFYSAKPFFIAAWRDLKIGSLTMDFPISLAIAGAYSASLMATLNKVGDVYFDSVCMFTFFLLIGRYFEQRVRYRTTLSARRLHQLLPVSCLSIKNGKTIRVPLQDVSAGDTVRILPGETVPADGVIIAGASRVSESVMNGEYMPAKKEISDKVIAGSQNIENAFDMRVEEVGNQTRLSGILHLMERTGDEKPRVVQMANQVASWFVGCVIIISIVVYFSWLQISPDQAFWITLSVLVITCPCALSLATPVALTAAAAALQNKGILIIRPHLLEMLPKATHVVFDKTGTLTYGSLSVVRMVGSEGQGYSDTELMEMAAALELHSSHPIASAFDQVQTSLLASDVRTVSGSGLEGWISGVRLRIGKPSFCLPNDSTVPPDTAGQWLLLSDCSRALAWFQLSDRIRPQAEKLVDVLKNSGLQTELLSGDQRSVVSLMADKLAVTYWQAECSPEDKLSRVRSIQAAGGKVVMVGDGINDVPVLSGADISIAVSTATDLTRTCADGVLLSSDLMRIAQAVALSKKTRAIILQNITWSLLYNLIALPVAACGLVPPWLAAIGMSFSSLVVLGNALRLTNSRDAVSAASPVAGFASPVITR